MPFIDLQIGGSGFSPGDATVTLTVICPAELNAGDVVYISGDKIGNSFQVDKVDITSFIKMPVAGIISQKLTSTTAVVMCSGELTGVFNALTPGATYYVDINGEISTAAPGSPTVGIRFVQAVAYALSSDTLHVRIQHPRIRVAN